MSFARHWARPLAFGRSARIAQSRRHATTKTMDKETDCYGIPLKPTWSVYDLISSYPKPVISPATLKHIHELSALTPPEEGTSEHERLQQELGDLVKLVEAVRLVNTDGVQFIGRRYKEDWDKELDTGTVDDGETGRSLLRHASRTADGFYLVDADRRR